MTENFVWIARGIRDYRRKYTQYSEF